jgi:hypothetical protein
MNASPFLCLYQDLRTRVMASRLEGPSAPFQSRQPHDAAEPVMKESELLTATPAPPHPHLQPAPASVRPLLPAPATVQAAPAPHGHAQRIISALPSPPASSSTPETDIAAAHAKHAGHTASAPAVPPHIALATTLTAARLAGGEILTPHKKQEWEGRGGEKQQHHKYGAVMTHGQVGACHSIFIFFFGDG